MRNAVEMPATVFSQECKRDCLRTHPSPTSLNLSLKREREFLTESGSLSSGQVTDIHLAVTFLVPTLSEGVVQSWCYFVKRALCESASMGCPWPPTSRELTKDPATKVISVELYYHFGMRNMCAF